MSASSKRETFAVLALAFVVRLVPVWLADRLVGDVLRYHKVAEGLLAGRWNPYAMPRLYPYPPVWMWFEAGSEWLARQLAIGFPILVKLPIVAADLGIVAVLASWPGDAARARRAAWIYALHPVAILITGVHGQFDALMLLCVLLAVRWLEARRPDASALALAAAVGLKSFPVLLAPFAAVRSGVGRWAAWRYALLATLPVALALVPFAVADLPALRRELLGYGGVADFGWIAVLRAADWLRGAPLERSEARFWGDLVLAAKVLFLFAYGALFVAFRRGRLRWSLPVATLAVFLLFQVAYGAVSAQYLLWVVPPAALVADRFFAAWSVAATVALVGFYAFLQPAILLGAPPVVAYDTAWAGRLWAAGVVALLVAGGAWLASLVRAGLARD